ncbi:sensor histidine kinase [Spirosoma validum]|uniref:Histidine kinase n=1 Tax=Spirosoma validum TaxID=2771355 RepID=A0A927B5Q7_9BACT|nr:histidine kinase [Spirosoma validum]MBD2755682.1 histidine kinase [Spirosoma validum]
MHYVHIVSLALRCPTVATAFIRQVERWQRPDAATGLFYTIQPNSSFSLDKLVDTFRIQEGSLLHFGYICMLMGLCLFLGLFSFVQSIYSQDVTYRNWAFYLWSNFLMFLAALNFIFKLDILNLGHKPWTSSAQFLVFSSYLLFINSFLEITRHQPNLVFLIRCIRWLLAAGFAYSIWAVSNYKKLGSVVDYADGFTFIIYVLILLLFIRIVKSGIPQTRLLIIGSMGGLLMGVVAAVLDQFNVNRFESFYFDPVVVFSIGVVFELTCFSLALSQRTRLIQLENQQLQQNYTRQLEQDLATRITTIQTQNQLLEEERLQRIINDFNQKIAETEMAALRAQMNPHFIFNCLNSIQFFTAQNNPEKASDYLTKFSRLIRLVLENSKSERVTLANELETLRLYIEMEAMRFPNKLHYQIQIDKEIDPESIQLPPLLLQPFVENAIWHGLMHKDEGGTVRIVVQQPQENLLHVEITDDGVGRKQAAEFKSKSATRKKSFGLKLTADRIALINQLYHTQTQINVIDLIDNQGNSKGTSVIVNIPT